MTQLAALNRGLDRVRRYRSTARWGSALAALGSALLLFLLGAFFLDVTTHMGRIERFIVLLGFGAVTLWALKRYVLPAIQSAESQLSLALMVERQQGIANDLVAALQFSDRDRTQYGSDDLRTAVVDYTHEAAGTLDYLEGFSRQQLKNRMLLLAVSVGLAAIVLVAFNAYSRVFFDRFLLGNMHYPTRTIIQDIASPGHRAVYGRPVRFRIRAEGDLPDSGRVQLSALSSGLMTTIDLTPDADDPTLYVGQLARALDDLTYTVYLGDAYTESLALELVPLPVVDVAMKIEMPAYAAATFDDDGSTTRRRVALEGSRVTPVITSDKQLRAATLTVNDESFPMTRDGEQFTLDVEATPLAAVESTVRYEVQVEDEDGLQLERPISGTLQVRADQPPRIAAATLTQYVLPTASPAITCRAIDDYALHTVVVRKRVKRANATEPPEESSTTIASLAQHPSEWEQTLRVDLSDLRLAKGDRVTLIFEAVDFRGPFPGKSADSERIVFQVTDRDGISAAMRQLDTQMDKKLDQIIRAHLGLGESP